jgi:hypothetical protein
VQEDGLNPSVELARIGGVERVMQAVEFAQRGVRAFAVTILGPGHVYHSKPEHARPSLLIGYGSILDEDIALGICELAALTCASASRGSRHPTRGRTPPEA